MKPRKELCERAMTKKLYVIEKGVPQPKPWNQLAKEMSVGDSVLVATKAEWQNLRYAVERLRGETCKVTSRREPDGNIRVWLVDKT